MSTTATADTLAVFIHYHVLFDTKESGSNTSLEYLQAAHNQLNSDFNAESSDISQVPSFGRYNFASSIGKSNIRFAPTILQELNVTRADFTGIRKDSVKRGNYVDYESIFFQASPMRQNGFLNIYIFPDRIRKQTGVGGWGYPSGEVKLFIGWKSMGPNSRQRGAFAHELGHALTLDHVYADPRGTRCSQRWPDQPISKNTNFNRDPFRKNETCRFDETTQTFEGLCDNVAVDEYLTQRGKTNESGFPFSCPGVEGENFLNFMDYSDFRRMFTGGQVEQMRRYILGAPASRYAGAGPQIAEPPRISGGPTRPVEFRRPYRLIASASNLRLGIVPFQGKFLAAPVLPGDDTEAIVFLSESATQFNQSNRGVTESMIVAISHYATGVVLGEAVENQSSHTVTFFKDSGGGDSTDPENITTFLIRTNVSEERITTTTPFLLTTNNLQLNTRTENGTVILGSAAEYWHLEEADLDITRPVFPLASAIPDYIRDQPPQPIRYNESYRIVRLLDMRQLNHEPVLQWVPSDLGGAPFIIKPAAAAAAAASSAANTIIVSNQDLVVLQAKNQDVEYSVGLLQLGPIGTGSSLLLDAGGDGSDTTALNTNTVFRIQVPIVSGFNFVETNEFNVALITERMDFLVRLQAESSGGLVVDTTVDVPEPSSGPPIQLSPVLFGERMVLESRNPATLANERFGFFQNTFGWSNTEWNATLKTPFQLEIVPPPPSSSSPSSSKTNGQPLETNDFFRLRFSDFNTWVSRNDAGLMWISSEESGAGLFQLFGTSATDLELILTGRQEWAGRDAEGVAIFTKNRSLRVPNLRLVPIETGAAEPPAINNNAPSGTSFQNKIILRAATSAAGQQQQQQAAAFGFVGGKFGFGATEFNTLELEIVGLSATAASASGAAGDILQTGSIPFETPFLLRYTKFNSWFEIAEFASFDVADADALMWISADDGGTGGNDKYLADAKDSNRRLGARIDDDGDIIATFGSVSGEWIIISTEASLPPTLPPPVAGSASVGGVTILFDNPYQLIRQGLDGIVWEVGTGPFSTNANLIQWVPRGTGHGVVLSAQNASGQVQHMSLVFISHVLTDQSLGVFVDDNPAFWLESQGGSIFRVETSDQQPVTCTSRLRLRRFPFDDESPPSYLAWTRLPSEEGGGGTPLDIIVTKNDASYSYSLECLDDSIAYVEAPTTEQRLAARQWNNNNNHNHNGNLNRNNSKNGGGYRHRMPATFPRSSGATTASRAGEDAVDRVLAFHEFSRLVHPATGRQLFPRIDGGGGGGLAWVIPTEETKFLSVVKIERESTVSGVFAQGDNGFIVSALYENKVFAASQLVGSGLFFGTPAAGTKFRFEGPNDGQSIVEDTILRIRLVFPQQGAATNLFLDIDTSGDGFLAKVSTNDAFQFSLQDQSAILHLQPLRTTNPLPYNTPLSIVDRSRRIEEADELASGGGAFGMYFAPRHYGALVVFQAPEISASQAAAIAAGEDHIILNGDRVLMVHAVGQRQVARDPQQGGRLDFVGDIGGDNNSLVFIIEAENGTVGDAIVVGDSIRLREESQAQYLSRDALTSTIVLSGDASYPFAMVESNRPVTLKFSSRVDGGGPTPTPTPTPGGGGDGDGDGLQTWWIWAIVAAVVIILIAIGIYLAQRRRQGK